MNTMQSRAQQNRYVSSSATTGVDEMVEFHIPEMLPPHYFFALDKGEDKADLILVTDDFIGGETEHRIDLDEAVGCLLQTFEEEPPVTLKERLDDVATLRTLARRFQSIASRLLQEARRRESEFQLPRRLAS